MNIFILLAIAAGLIAIQLVASRFVKLNRLAWMALWWVALYLVFSFGITPPLPSSIVVLFMAIVTLALLAYLSADSEELEEAKQAIENFLVEKKYTVQLLIVVVVVPLLVAFKVYSDMTKPPQAPLSSRLEKAIIYESIMDPDAVIAEGFPAAVMNATLSGLGFHDQVSVKELQTLVNYLAEQ